MSSNKYLEVYAIRYPDDVHLDKPVAQVLQFFLGSVSKNNKKEKKHIHELLEKKN
jgi:hypothetical protein